MLRRRLRKAPPPAGRRVPGEAAPEFSELPDLARRAAFVADHVLIHTHIPKTAGSALAAGLSSIVGGVRAMDTRQRRGIPLEALPDAELDRLDLVTGHFGYGVHTRFRRTPLYFAAVRDPVLRAVSDYRFLLEHPDHGGHARVLGRSFEEAWVAEDERNPAGSRDLQSRMITGARPGAAIDSDALRRQVEEVYFLVVPQDEVTPAIHRLRAAFGAAWMRTPPTNVSRGNHVSVAPGLAARIRAANPADCALHAMVAETFERRLSEACRYIASHCLQPLEG